jgi:hypothetical protein
MAGVCAACCGSRSTTVGALRLANAACASGGTISWHFCAPTGESARRLAASAIVTPVQSRAAIALDLPQFRVENDAMRLQLLNLHITTGPPPQTQTGTKLTNE